MTLDRFLSYLKYEKRYSEKTITAYHCDIQQFADFCKNRFELIELVFAQPHMIREWLAELKIDGMNNRSINRKKSAVQSFYKFCQQIDSSISNPLKAIPSLKVRTKTAQFVPESDMNNHQLSSESDFVALRNYLVVEFLYQTGLRKAELLSLNWNHFDFSRKVVKFVGKGNKERIVPLTSGLIDVINTYRTLQQKMFPSCQHFMVSRKGRPMSPAGLHTIVDLELGSITSLHKKSPHVLRHTFATHLLNNGAPLIAIKELLGHSSLAATQLYTHNSIAELKKIHQKAHPKG